MWRYQPLRAVKRCEHNSTNDSFSTRWLRKTKAFVAFLFENYLKSSKLFIENSSTYIFLLIAPWSNIEYFHLQLIQSFFYSSGHQSSKETENGMILMAVLSEWHMKNIRNVALISGQLNFIESSTLTMYWQNCDTKRHLNLIEFW